MYGKLSNIYLASSKNKILERDRRNSDCSDLMTNHLGNVRSGCLLGSFKLSMEQTE